MSSASTSQKDDQLIADSLVYTSKLKPLEQASYIRSLTTLINNIQMNIGFHGKVSDGTTQTGTNDPNAANLAILGQLSIWFLADEIQQILALAEAPKAGVQASPSQPSPNPAPVARKLLWTENSNSQWPDYNNDSDKCKIIAAPLELVEKSFDNDWFSYTVCRGGSSE